MEKYKRSYAKVNIFLKVTGKRNGYHELVSRFVKINNLWDEIYFIKTNKKCFDITGNFSCSLEKNTIYKIYKLIENMPNVKSFFEKYSVKVCKNIPEFAGLGGGSSNAAVFLLMVNEYCRLGLSKDSMAKIGVKVGADIPFFIYEYNSANVTGIGEVVKEFKEEALKIEVFTPLIKCDTSEIFKIFREKFYKEISFSKKNDLIVKKSKEILKEYAIDELNDLYIPAVYLKKELKQYEKEDWFFSGSGSSFFKLI